MTRRRADGPPSVLPFFLNAELQELGSLSTAALGAHWRLVYWAWAQGKDPEDNDDLLARIVRLRPVQWRGVRAELLTVWRIDGGRWLHDRFCATVAEANGKRRVNSGNGRAGGKAKAAKSLKKHGEHMPNASNSAGERQTDAALSEGAAEPEDLWDLVKGRFPEHLRRSWLDRVTLICIDQDGVAQMVALSSFVAERVGGQMADEVRRAFAACGVMVRAINVGVGGIDLGRALAAEEA